MNFEAFADSLLDSVGLQEPSLREDAKNNLLDTLFQRLMMASIAELPNEEQKKLEEFDISTDEGKRQLFDFLSQHIPSYEIFILKQCEEFAQEYLDHMQIKNTLKN